MWVQFIMLLTLKSVNETLVYDCSIKSYSAELANDTVYSK